ncbi:hypothetical protein [Flavobacterium branchiophilum]|uniref:Uncharacterized protein n=1 Tax=Flavobacterium branchiophilum TaxID=55197 RepID=A0A543G2L2_9FLAO|nr:hypothetical protein [Flavobacterium branchiophilum]TQM40275.1 hypothetical protein BC670_1153 [Flavobacterium branchiophilum]GEM53972.1 hypothetical protein FB1_01930 [Flavobacterium branchiophilum NBRC 15030 = ATCC 35035]
MKKLLLGLIATFMLSTSALADNCLLMWKDASGRWHTVQVPCENIKVIKVA